ncbi:unnamed protein product [Urochloa decumbens]|uniref:F-box domain-containing protein n=1 Tax=Urochloa decumbens TaxID=240449 RepID=A0ABC9CAC9_9POAL
MASEEHEQQEHLASMQELEQEDRLSHDILLSILERIKLREAARTSVLSRRWRCLFGLRSRIIVETDDFHSKGKGSNVTQDDLVQISNKGVVEATKSMLAPTYRHPITQLRLRFFLVEDSVGIIRCVDEAMANRGITTLQFLIHPEILDMHSTEDDMVTYGRRFMRFLGAGPRAFGGLSYLFMHCLRLGVDDMASVLNTCKKLDYLCLNLCDFFYCGTPSVLQIDHPQLTTLTLAYCTFERVKLNWLPRLNRLNVETWSDSQDQYPIRFGCVPNLSVLVLRNRATIHHKTIHLSSFLSNVMLGVLDLDFDCKKVWDHTSCEHIDEERQQLYQKESNLLTRMAPADFKHYNLKELTIKGYQVDEKFTGYVRCVVEAAINLEHMVLLDSGSCERCKFSPSTSFPRTQEGRELIRKQILQWTY